MDILLGISAALGWGVADFSARFSARRIGAFRTLMLMQFFGFTALSLFLWLTGGFARSFPPGWTPWAFAVVAGLINTFAGYCLYRSFEVGLISIAGPVSSSYPALTVALAIASGERISALRGAGLALTFVGMILALSGVEVAASSTGVLKLDAGTTLEKPSCSSLRGELFGR